MSRQQTLSLIREATGAAHSFTQRNVDGSAAIGLAAIASAISELAEAIREDSRGYIEVRPDGGVMGEMTR